jgi:hypothetical protein
MEQKERIQILKSHENECYRICLYLLDCESLALEAATITLHDLYFDHLFFKNNISDQKLFLRFQ